MSNPDATRQLLLAIVAMRNQARESMRSWSIEPHPNAERAEKWRQVRAEHNIVLSKAASLGLTDGVDLWEGE